MRFPLCGVTHAYMNYVLCVLYMYICTVHVRAAFKIELKRAGGQK